MTSAQLLADAFERIREPVHEAVEGLSPEDLAFRPDPAANTVAWLVWHLTRVQDDHVAKAAGVEQTWTAAKWSERFALPFDVADTGYGHGAAEVGAVTASSELLAGYYDATSEATLRFVRQVTDADLERIVDERWDPPVTLGVRLVSVITDDLQHAGQASYLRGLLERR